MRRKQTKFKIKELQHKLSNLLKVEMIPRGSSFKYPTCNPHTLQLIQNMSSLNQPIDSSTNLKPWQLSQIKSKIKYSTIQ